MRIDKFLKVSRIIKRRTVAAAACSGGRVFSLRQPGVRCIYVELYPCIESCAEGTAEKRRPCNLHLPGA